MRHSWTANISFIFIFMLTLLYLELWTENKFQIIKFLLSSKHQRFMIMSLVANHFNIGIMSLIGLLLVLCFCVQFMVVAYSLRDIGTMT